VSATRDSPEKGRDVGWTHLTVEKRMNGEESEKACTAAVQARRVAALESCMASGS